MNTKEKIKKELDDLLNDAKNLITYLEGENEKEILFVTDYQHWYTRALKAVDFFAPDRLSEFKSYYEINPKRKNVDDKTYTIQDFIKGSTEWSINSISIVDFTGFSPEQRTLKNLSIQYAILNSISTRIDSALSQAEATLFAELQDSELEEAKKILKINPRAAGALAGVILEGFLQKIAKNHDVAINKADPTINDLNEPLKQAGVYDLTCWKKIQYLAAIRNCCIHKKSEEPKFDQVKELIEGVNWAIKNRDIVNSCG